MTWWFLLPSCRLRRFARLEFGTIEVLSSKKKDRPTPICDFATQPQRRFESFFMPARVALLHDHTITCCTFAKKWVCILVWFVVILETFFIEDFLFDNQDFHPHRSSLKFGSIPPSAWFGIWHHTPSLCDVLQRWHHSWLITKLYEVTNQILVKL